MPTTLKNTSPPLSIPADEAIGLAIRVEDALGVMDALLDGAQATTSPDNMKLHTMILMARDRARHLEWVAYRLRGGARA